MPKYEECVKCFDLKSFTSPVSAYPFSCISEKPFNSQEFCSEYRYAIHF